MPSTKEVISLLELYFEITGDIFPYLDKATVLSYLAPDRKGNPVKLRGVEACIINTCLAFAIIHGQPEINKSPDMEIAHIYIQRAKAALPETLSQSPSLETSKCCIEKKREQKRKVPCCWLSFELTSMDSSSSVTPCLTILSGITKLIRDMEINGFNR